MFCFIFIVITKDWHCQINFEFRGVKLAYLSRNVLSGANTRVLKQLV